MLKILITGSNGLLGQKVASLLATETGHEVLLTSIERENYLRDLKYDYNQLDITIRSDVKSLVQNFRPDIIVNTAAFTNVDDCETDREYAWRLNVDAVKHLIIAARIVNARIIHLSTDYVFNGKNIFYDENSIPNPINYYGRTKLASENALIESGVKNAIIRTMVLYGLGKSMRANFALWVVNQLQGNQVINVADDQFCNPTFVDDLSYCILKILETNRTGSYHICGSENISRYKFAVNIADIFGLDDSLVKLVKTRDLGLTAIRPLKSGFNCFKATSQLGIKLLDTESGLYVLKRQIEMESYYKIK